MTEPLSDHIIDVLGNSYLEFESLELINVEPDSIIFKADISSSLILGDVIFTNLIGPPKSVYIADRNSYIDARKSQSDLPAATEAAYSARNFSSIRSPDDPNDKYPGPVITEIGGQVLPN